MGSRLFLILFFCSSAYSQLFHFGVKGSAEVFATGLDGILHKKSSQGMSWPPDANAV
jgi:hypothetical protein